MWLLNKMSTKSYYNRKIRQNTLRNTVCSCGVHFIYRKRKIHAPWCDRVVAMRNLMEMWDDGVIRETTSLDRTKKKTGRFHFSAQDSRLGYWEKDVETGRWYLKGVKKEFADIKIVPLYTYQEEKEKRHG